ncbi:ABC transporter permease [Actinoplanes capillaceus]|uniref:ABC transporter permease n=1 Tax=Actinoplanes campanulatus TaxID=113559 RepID=A0ABQ3WAM3_9ACTN|nr:ABC transporter permease [Actinoplanes capillaceus]GID42951.1 ABC transporter permease [Actinoplanes capillaceus]
MSAPPLVPARMPVADVIRVGGHGLRSRPLRVFLSALGIAIGIAAMVGVMGISASSTHELDRRLSSFGTNLLTVTAEQESHLPTTAVSMIGALPDVDSVSAVGRTGVRVYRNDHIPTERTGGIVVYAARTDLPTVAGARTVAGSWLTEAHTAYPAVVLGWTAARSLAVYETGPDQLVWLGGRWFTVVGILAPNDVLTDLDYGAFVGWPVAERELGFDGYPTIVYTRPRQSAVTAVQPLLGAAANPENPGEAGVSRPSEVLKAQLETRRTLNALLLGLGAVALLVGGIGVANTMVISVLERRSEIGLRRSLGATRGQIRTQFLAEALLLSLLGGAGGVALGIGITAAFAATQGWAAVVPPWAMTGGVAATLLIGGVAGFYPAVRAARLPPTEALANP